MFFPPSFFDIMIHLMVHLVREAKLCGPVWARWMYPFERSMKVLKSYVRNHYRPEASMVECYISEEAVEFCSEYMSGVEAIGIKKPRNNSDGVDKGLRGNGTVTTVSRAELDQAQLVVLQNNPEIQSYIIDHIELLRSMIPNKIKNKQKWVIDEHNKTFCQWLKNTILTKLGEKNHGLSTELKRISLGASIDVIKHQAYIVEGKRFHTKSRDDARLVQNNGVSVVAEVMHFASAKDNNPISDNNTGVKTDELGFILDDLSKKGSKNDPFIMASQAKKCFTFLIQLMINGPLFYQLPSGSSQKKKNGG
ncbi:uncharacterized protein LOC133823624 [Humulus lupulus]|uniref:uncharacterized protein LOC133823624 n=1 Tax=Humulus lupulus TaxID=3486 RepID=UPI002B410D70|nr:uncharacterized protein LOC133823624 [Humulus lupulus]